MRAKIGFVFIVAFCLAVAESPTSASNAKQRSASELLTCSIAYHDPDGSWQKQAFKITDVSRRPDGTVATRTIIRYDNGHGRFDMESRRDGHVITASIQNGVVKEIRLDGKKDSSNEEIQHYELTPEKMETRYKFFLYLHGLPMKLNDPGTRLDEKPKLINFQGRSVYELRVTYDANVGNETWYFYVDRKSCALVGHRFYHNETKGDGEYTVLSGEVVGQGLKLPQVRKWYGNQDNKLFITHTIESIEAP